MDLPIALCSRQPGAVAAVLSQAGVAHQALASEPALRRALRQHSFAGLVVDLGHQDGPWAAFAQAQRPALDPALFVVLVGAAGRWAQVALQREADDFVADAQVAHELLPRLRRAWQRRRPAVLPGAGLAHGGCQVDTLGSRLVGARGQVALTARELSVARCLFAHGGAVVSRQRLAQEVWGCDEAIAGRAIEQHIYQLRRKLQRCCGATLSLRGVYGAGYRLCAEHSEGACA